MTRRFFSVASLALVLVANGVVSTAASADDPPVDPPPDPPVVQPVRIMLSGDSITQGFDGDYTWRYRLWQEFQRQKVAVDFVGPNRYPYGGYNHYLVSGWDSDHDGVGGRRLHDQVTVPAGQAENKVTQVVRKYHPDVLVATYGTTDLIHGGTVDSVTGDLRTYIESARAEAPNMTILLGQVMSLRVPIRAKFNAAVKKMVKDVTTPESPVYVVDFENGGWDPAKHTFDRTHPTPVGETVIAQRVAWALRGIGVLHDPPTIRRSSVPWAPVLVTKLSLSRRGRLVVNWNFAKKQNRVQYMRLRITDHRSGRVRPFRWTRDARSVTTLAPGRYTVAVRGMRGTMTSTWTQVRTFTVPRR
jgi:hypothetical protein